MKWDETQPCTMPRVRTDSHHTRVLTDSYHIMPKPMCDKIHNFWITSNDNFTKQIHLFSNQKIFGCYTSMIIYIQNHVSFCGQRIFGIHLRLRAHLPTLSQAFTFRHICITENTEAFTQGGIYPCLLLLDTYFHFHVYSRATLLDVVPAYRSHPIKH